MEPKTSPKIVPSGVAPKPRSVADPPRRQFHESLGDCLFWISVTGGGMVVSGGVVLQGVHREMDRMEKEYKPSKDPEAVDYGPIGFGLLMLPVVVVALFVAAVLGLLNAWIVYRFGRHPAVWATGFCMAAIALGAAVGCLIYLHGVL